LDYLGEAPHGPAVPHTNHNVAPFTTLTVDYQ
jgi:hypothetical protein